MEGAIRLRAWLGLGSNVGDRLAHLRSARLALGRRGIEVLTASSVYETAPQAGAIGQEDFLNAVLEVETSLDPFELLAACKDVEFELGRDPGAAHHAARPIDVDLLIAEGHAFESDRLTLPHPDILERRFVLEPLLEVDPELRLPDGSPLADALPGVREQRVTRAGPL